MTSRDAAKETSSAARVVHGAGSAELNDVDLARIKEQVRNGDNTEFNDLCCQLMPRLLRQALILCGNSTQAEDLVQETLVEAWRVLPRFGGRCRFFTWVCAILINRYRNVARRNSARGESSAQQSGRDGAEEMLGQTPDSGVRPDQAAEETERNDRLRESLEGLPHRQREVIYLRFYAGDTLEGIASAVGCSVGTVKSRLFHGLERLRKMKAVQRTGVAFSSNRRFDS